LCRSPGSAGAFVCDPPKKTNRTLSRRPKPYVDHGGWDSAEGAGSRAMPRSPRGEPVARDTPPILAHRPGRLYGPPCVFLVRKSPFPCLPTPSSKPPSGSAWVHEIKHDGYRLIARRDGNRVRLFIRRGYEWSAKYPWIVESLLSLRVRSIIVDGEAVWAGKDGMSDFDKLHSGK
jgi:ATP-dependent DNA ligase